MFIFLSFLSKFNKIIIISKALTSQFIMGNTNAESEYLKMHIQTEKLFYNSGSSIEGVVFIEALNNFHFDALYIRIEGEQWCQWFQGSSKNRVKYTGNDDFYEMEYLLDKYENQNFAKGKYAYPFSIQLSENIPGSFQSATYDAKIQYKLIAYFVNYSHAHMKQSVTLPLIIREPFRQEIVSYKGQSTTNPVTCGCFSKGQVKLSAEFQRNVCFEGQKINIQVIADNRDGTSHLDQVIIRLVQYTFVSANNGVSRTYKNIVYTHKLGAKVQKGQEKKLNHNLTVPNVKNQTAISTLVANYYRIQVTASLGTFSSENPSIYSPIFILKKSYQVKNQIKKLNLKHSNYETHKMVLFRAPQYWFRKNKHLSVMNFRQQDIISSTGSVFINK